MECWSKAIRRDRAKSYQNYRNKEANKQKELRVPSHSFLRPSYFPEESHKAVMTSSLLCSASIICLRRTLSVKGQKTVRRGHMREGTVFKDKHIRKNIPALYTS
jgi:hypothetical protein